MMTIQQASFDGHQTADVGNQKAQANELDRGQNQFQAGYAGGGEGKLRDGV